MKGCKTRKREGKNYAGRKLTPYINYGRRVRYLRVAARHLSAPLVPHDPL